MSCSGCKFSGAGCDYSYACNNQGFKPPKAERADKPKTKGMDSKTKNAVINTTVVASQ